MTAGRREHKSQVTHKFRLEVSEVSLNRSNTDFKCNLELEKVWVSISFTQTFD